MPESSVARALRLLRQLAAEDEAMSLSKLARATGVPKSSTHRVLSILNDEGVVSRSSHGHELHPEWTRLLHSSRSSRERRLRRALTPFLVDLYVRTGLCSDLVWWRHGQVEAVASIFGHGDPAMAENEADTVLAHHLAARKLFLAAELPRGIAPAEQLELSHPVRRELAHIRSTGIAVAASEPVPWALGLATSVQVAPGLPPVALCVGGPAERVEVHYTGVLLRQTAYAASVRLRQGPTGPPRAHAA